MGHLLLAVPQPRPCDRGKLRLGGGRRSPAPTGPPGSCARRQSCGQHVPHYAERHASHTGASSAFTGEQPRPPGGGWRSGPGRPLCAAFVRAPKPKVDAVRTGRAAAEALLPGDSVTPCSRAWALPGAMNEGRHPGNQGQEFKSHLCPMPPIGKFRNLSSKSSDGDDDGGHTWCWSWVTVGSRLLPQKLALTPCWHRPPLGHCHLASWQATLLGM